MASPDAAAAAAAAAASDGPQGPITHVIFDMDGLLLDTETFYTVAQQRILQQYGREFTWALKSRMMGKKALEAAQVLVDELQLHGELTPEEFIRQREAILDELFPSSQLMPGAERLVRHLKDSGVPIAVATSSHRRHFEKKTQAHAALFDLFDLIVTGDQVQRGKPAPDIFLRAAAGFARPPRPSSSALVFEDAPAGVQAGVAAGMRVVMVPDPNLDRAAVDGCGASAVLGSLEQFRPELWGLPPYRDRNGGAAAAAAAVEAEAQGISTADGEEGEAAAARVPVAVQA